MVGIAGLGTLYKKKSPGRYDAEKHAFVPPSYQLAFTSEIKESEELATYISEDRHISIDSANYFINEFADKILAQLADHQEALLPSIGLLKVADNELILVPEENGQVSHETYGLPTVADINPATAEEETTATPEEEKLEAIEEENKLEEENPGSTSDSNWVPSAPADADEQPVFEEINEVSAPQKSWDIERTIPPVIETAEEEVKVVEVTVVPPPPPPMLPAQEEIQEIAETPQPSGMSLTVKILIVLAVILLAGAIAYFVNPKFFDKYIQNNHQDQPKSSVRIVPNDSLSTQVDSANQGGAAKVGLAPAAVKDSTAIDSNEVYYEVIGTSYKTKAAAEAYIAKLASFGIKATIADMPGTWQNISLGTFSDLKLAHKLKDSLLVKNKGVYIQKIKPKKSTK